MSGPWQVSGPALAPGAQALRNTAWSHATRIWLAADAARLNAMVRAPLKWGTTLFLLYNTDDAQHRQSALARHHIRNRVFPCSARWLRLGLPGPDGRDGLHTTALATL
jgi:cobalamin biosynthetic protein CobC